MSSILKKIEPVLIQKPSDIVLTQIKNIISSGELKPGDKLPPERTLAERFGLGRSHIREAIKKLEFYGIVVTLPQSGTIVANLGINLIKGMIANVLQLEKDNFKSLLETRTILEIEAVRLTTERLNDEKIKKLNKVHQDYKKEIEKGNDGLDEDLLFHLQIAEFSENTVLRSILMLIIPEVVNLSKKRDTCKNERPQDALKEHHVIIESIKSKDPLNAAQSMRTHMNNTIKTVG